MYKASDIKLLIPESQESGPGGIVPSTSIITQASLGSSLVIAVMKYKKHGIMSFKKWHPAGSLSKKLLTVGDLMISGNDKVPFVNENLKMKEALKILTKKKLGLLVVRSKRRLTTGLIVDGDVKRASQKYKSLHDLKVKDIMTKKPLSVDKDILIIQSLTLMNSKRITSLLVHKNNKKNKTIGVLHIHKVLENIQ